MSRTNAAFGEIRIPAAEIDALRERAIRAESERDALRAEVERLREALDMIGNHGLDARQCMQAARAALSSPPSGG